MVSGHHRSGLAGILPWAEQLGAALISVEYRLAPENPHPAPVEDGRSATSALGERRGGPDAPAYAAPARADDLSGLPPAYVDVGSLETFRDEDVAYAVRLWQAGTQAELHVWPGGFHGFDGAGPEAAISRAAGVARLNWLRRLLTTG